MEAVALLDSRPATTPGALPGAGPSGARAAVALVPAGTLGHALGAVKAMAASAIEDVALLDLPDAAAFAAGLEELSRTLDYLQVVAAGHLDRVRLDEPPARHDWTTGWGAGAGWAPTEASPGPAATGSAVAGSAAAAGPPAGPAAAGSAAGARPEAAAPEFRTTTEYLRSLLRISAAEARRRLALAAAVLPRQGLAGQPMPPHREDLAHALACGTISSRAATTITTALDRVRPYSCPDTAVRMEHALTATAAENDPDFLARIARRWTDALDQDGTEPSEEQLRHSQGAFLRRPRNGLQHLEIFATTDQFEHLLTVMNTATNPRTGTGRGATAGEADNAGTTNNAQQAGPHSGGPSASDPAGSANPAGSADAAGSEDAADCPDPWDRRSRAQKLLDGLVGACKTALATGTLPATGGLRPQILVTIDYQTLLAELRQHGTDSRNAASTGTGRGGTGAGFGTAGGTASFAFSGPANARSIRKIACDADIIPVLLGGDGQILDVGRASRVFPPHIRKAITARDQGCAFPGCTIPAPWCEAHHITYWSQRGPTSTSNGTLLCSHHHHVIHKENWHIENRTGVPWFIPPPHIDPRQQPRQNHYFHD